MIVFLWTPSHFGSIEIIDAEHASAPAYLLGNGKPFAYKAPYHIEHLKFDPVFVNKWTYTKFNPGIRATGYSFNESLEPTLENILLSMDDPNPDFSMKRIRYGLPMNSVRLDRYNTNASNLPQASLDAFTDELGKKAGLSDGIPITWNAWTRHFPVVPMWGGLIVDILFWSVLWYALGSVRGKIRSWRFSRKGRCVGCGYSLEGTAGCPECGRDIQTQAA